MQVQYFRVEAFLKIRNYNRIEQDEMFCRNLSYIVLYDATVRSLFRCSKNLKDYSV